MSLADVAASMQRIQLQIAELSGTAAPASSGAAGAAAFADALSGATASTGTASATASATAASAVGGAAAAGSVSGHDVVRSALEYVGTPYVLGGESKRGIDCSGLVQRAFGDLGISVPRLVHQQKTIGTEVPSLRDAKPGDLVVLNGGDHIAIWLGDGKVVHAPYEGRTVSVQKAWFTDKDVVTIRRVVPSEAVAAAAPAPALAALGAAAGSGTTSDSSFLSSLTGSLGVGGTSSSGTAQQLLAARSAMLGTVA